MEDQKGERSMISFDFEYYKPVAIEEAVSKYKELKGQGKTVLYYGGGTEIISLARMNQLYTEAVIDLKDIPECNEMKIENENIIIGSSNTLTNIYKVNLFPPLSLAARRIADHTIQEKITLGGNICGRLLYRETALPLMICDSLAVVAGINGIRTIPFNQIFNQYIHLEDGEFIIKFLINKSYANLKYIHVKRTKQDKITYPITTIVAIKKDDRIRFAVSGLCAFPFGSIPMEDALNDKTKTREERAANTIKALPVPILSDIEGSAEYKEHVFKGILEELIDKFDEVI